MMREVKMWVSSGASSTNAISPQSVHICRYYSVHTTLKTTFFCFVTLHRSTNGKKRRPPVTGQNTSEDDWSDDNTGKSGPRFSHSHWLNVGHIFYKWDRCWAVVTTHRFKKKKKKIPFKTGAANANAVSPYALNICRYSFHTTKTRLFFVLSLSLSPVEQQRQKNEDLLLQKIKVWLPQNLMPKGERKWQEGKKGIFWKTVKLVIPATLKCLEFRCMDRKYCVLI